MKKIKNPTVFERSKCIARLIRASQKLFRSLPLFEEDAMKEDLVSVYCLTTSNQKEAISGTVSGWHL